MSCEKERKRAPNWTNAETMQLLEDVFERYHIIRGHHRDLANAEKAKDRAWREISDNVSAISSYRRTVDDCKTKHQNLMKNASKRVSAYNKAMRGTGIDTYILSIAGAILDTNHWADSGVFYKSIVIKMSENSNI